MAGKRVTGDTPPATPPAALPGLTAENDATLWRRILPVCGCGHLLRDHDDTGKCVEWWRYPEVLKARECGCVKPWTRVFPPGGTDV